MSEPAFSLFKELLPMVPEREKRRFIALLFIAVLMALTELAITGFVALLAAFFSSPESVLGSKYMLWLTPYLPGILSTDQRLLATALLCVIVLAIACKNALMLFQQYHISIFSESVGAHARAYVFRLYQRLPYLWLAQKGVAELQFGLNSAVYLAGSLNFLLQIFTGCMLIVMLFIGLFCVSPLPSFFFVLTLGVGGFLVVKSIRGIQDRRAKRAYSEDRQLVRLVHLSLHGLKEIRLYNRENQLYTVFRAQLDRIVTSKSLLQFVARLPVASLEILGFSTLALVMLLLVFVQDASMARISGTMGFMAATAWRALPPANRLVDAFAAMRNNLPYLQRVVKILREERALASEVLPLSEEPGAPLPFNDAVCFDHVSFRYPNAAAPAISDCSLKISAGSMVGIVGLSGAGKSTLVNLLTGLLAPDSGLISVDGTTLTRDNCKAWLRQIGYVAQAPYILDASLAENIGLSRFGEDIDRDRVLECCRMASLDFLDSLENGIDTILGDRGTRLSGGQAQRVAIARALYSNPKLIIFDEATSALDMKNEKAIHNTILSLRNQVTLIIVAHRLSTIEGCDQLVWMEQGKIRGVGSNADVLPDYVSFLRKQESLQSEVLS